MTDRSAPTPFPPLLTAEDVAIALNISLRTVRRLIKGGKLRSVRIGHLVRVRPEALEALIGAE